MRLRWTEHAKLDLLAIIEFIARDKRGAARTEGARIRQGIQVLREQPLIGRVVPELDIASLRERIVPPYRIIYQVRDQEVIVLAVIRDSRELSRLVVASGASLTSPRSSPSASSPEPGPPPRSRRRR